MLLKIVAISILVTLTYSQGLPPSLSSLRCRRSDRQNFDQCFLNGLNQSWPALVAGVPQINLPPSDPYHTDYQETQSSLQPLFDFKLIFRNLTDTGYARAYNYRFHADLDNYSGYIQTYIPSKHIETNYEVDGKFLSFQAINDQGFAVVDLTNINVTVVIKFKIITQNSQNYFQLDKVSMDIHVKEGHMKLTSNNPNRQGEADSFAEFFNNNSKILMEITSPFVERKVIKIFKENTNPSLASVPVDDWFLD